MTYGSLPRVESSCERLTHFRCADARCQQWWSIADFDTQPNHWSQAVIFCPRCGRPQRLDGGDEGALAA